MILRLSFNESLVKFQIFQSIKVTKNHSLGPPGLPNFNGTRDLPNAPWKNHFLCLPGQIEQSWPIYPKKSQPQLFQGYFNQNSESWTPFYIFTRDPLSSSKLNGRIRASLLEIVRGQSQSPTEGCSSINVSHWNRWNWWRERRAKSSVSGDNWQPQRQLPGPLKNGDSK